MLVRLAAACTMFLLVSLVSAQHHHDPFAGSGCTCDTFCNNSCSVFPGNGPKNLTLYRMTPFGVLDMTNKNTGDAHGDTSFVLSRKTSAYQCREDPTSFQCHNLAQFTGDDPNSTDLILELEIQVDQQWGPYLYCNPNNASNEDKGPWSCLTSISPGGGTPTPPQCKADNFTVFDGYCWEGLFPAKSKVAGVGDCCAAASAAGVSKWTYDDGTCLLYKLALTVAPCSGGKSGYYGGSPACDCPRVHQTMGRENISSSSTGLPSSAHPAGGEWYSHPIEGECLNGHHVGDGSGCSWEVLARNKVINATCMYKRLDANVEAYESACFKACPQPTNVTSTCYLRCYSEATEAMTADQLAEPWHTAFTHDDPASGGCPPAVEADDRN